MIIILHKKYAKPCNCLRVSVLQMNDLMRDKLCNKDGSISLWAECLSGGIVCRTDFLSLSNHVIKLFKNGLF